MKLCFDIEIVSSKIHLWSEVLKINNKLKEPIPIYNCISDECPHDGDNV